MEEGFGRGRNRPIEVKLDVRTSTAWKTCRVRVSRGNQKPFGDPLAIYLGVLTKRESNAEKQRLERW